MGTKLNVFADFLRDIYKSRRLITGMVKNDFKVKYASSALGILWAFVQPLVQILVLIFVFSVGFRSGPTSTGVPFALWLICGLVPWNFFADALTNGSNSLVEYSYLVKKVVFRTAILPIVKTFSSLIVHGVFIVIIFVVAAVYGYFPTIYTLQIFYYLPCLLFMLLGLNWMFSALAAFFRDVSQFINVALQILIWMTPILWSIDILPRGSERFFKLNPMFYIVQGYRDCFSGNTWFWERPVWSMYFFGVMIACFSAGAMVFHKLRPHFSDVL
ncbi:MAG: ABC transporter permease [Clostridiaceae bacterium]|nr:ABC transporter permease [Clostridiaceae bacterium]